MSVQNQTVKNVYAGNGSTTVFPFTFALLETDGEYVKVYVTNEAGTSEETTNFTIDTQAKTVTYPTTGDPLPADKKIVIRRAIPNEQELNLENLGPFFAEDVEGEFDRTVMMIQQLQEEADRSIKVDQASDTPPEELVADLFEAAADAAASATAAHNSELAAAASETAAGNSATAAGNSATAAYNSEVAAGSSATAAGNSATAAYNSQVAAASSETNAGNSATAANNSKIAAATSETNAGNSATAAGNSATAAHNSEVAAKASEDAAAQSASEAAGITYLVRKNSTAYAEGVVAFYSTVPSPLVLECTTAGTTAATAPDFSGAVEGGTITDGSVVWTYKGLISDDGANKNLSNLTATGEQKLADTTESVVYEDGFAIIYPNGGSESSPASITYNTRYVETNPFPGYHVRCIAEVFSNNEWGELPARTFSSSQSLGVQAFDFDGSIVIQTGKTYLAASDNGAWGVFPFSSISTTTYTLPCRVKVWKIGKVANNA